MNTFDITLVIRRGGPEVLFNKLNWSHMNQRMAETSLEMEGVLSPLVAGDPRSR